MKHKKWFFRVGALFLCMATLLSACKPQAPAETEPSPTAAPTVQYTVTVKTNDGQAVKGVGVYIYEGSKDGEIVDFSNTDDNGTMTFSAPQSDQRIAVLENIPTGYAAQESYPITGQNTEIVLSMGVMTEEDLNSVVYQLGDKVLDFTVTDLEGTEHTLSKLLKTKKAVVLNFWFMGCEPCEREFPCLQEAWLPYQQDVAILAMNPLANEKPEQALNYMKEMGITFPMALVEEQWSNIMQLAGYPTTVVIDRTGTICLIQNGSLESTDTFSQLFAYFTAEDYESKPIENLEDIITQSDLGTKGNPHETDASKRFDITVKPGETYYIHLYKQMEKFYLSVEGGQFTLRYKNQDYPSENGSTTLYIKPEGVFVPVELEITNTSDKEQTYTVGKSNPRGSYSNPYSLALGEFDTKVSAGNEQGVYYTYRMPEDGTLRVTALEATAGVVYDFTLYNLNSYAQRTLESAGTTDDEGHPYLEIQGRAGQKIQFVVNTLPDNANSYPACNLKLLAQMNAGEVEEIYKPPETVYTVTVVDESGIPMKDVAMLFTGDFIHIPPQEEGEEGAQPETPEGGEEGEEDGVKEYPINVSLTLLTNESGVATTKQVSGPYSVSITLPEGYKAEVTKFDLTAEEPEITVTLNKIIQKDYSVTLLYPDGTPLSGAAIMLGSEYKLTDDNGTVSFHLDEGQYSVIVTGIPEGYVLPEKKDTFAFPENETELVLTLVGIGGKENPYIAETLPFTTKTLEADETVYIRITAPLQYADSPILLVKGSAATVTLGEQSYTTIEDVATIPLIQSEEPLEIAVTHQGVEPKSLTLEVTYPVGTQWNPEVLESLENVTLCAPEGSEKGYYYQYTSANAGTHTLQLAAAVDGAVTVTTERDGTVAITQAAVTVYQKIDETVVFHVQANPAAEGDVVTYPAVSAALTAGFEIDWDAVPEGQRVYTVTVQTPDKKGLANVMVQIYKNDSLLSYGLTDSNGQYKAMLNAAVYNVELSLPETTTKYYYDVGGYAFSLGSYELIIPLVKNLPGTPTTNFLGSYNVGAAAPVRPLTYYVSLQADTWKYFILTAPKEGTYRISVTDPSAFISYCGADYRPNKATMDNAVHEYNLSVQKDQYKSTKYIFAVTGTADTLLSITRVGDPEFDPSYTEADNSWHNGYVPTASAIPTNISNPQYVDIKDQTAGQYVPVYNEADGFYHMGTEDGPIIYLDLNDNAPYVSLKVAVCGVEGSPAGGTAFGRYFYDSVSGKFLRREQYDACIREYVEVLRSAGCSEDGERFYPLTYNLAYILRTGCVKWWEDEKELYYETFQGYNPDTVWMFACCTFE